MKNHLIRFVIATLYVLPIFTIVGVGRAKAAAGDIYNLGTLGGSSSSAFDINDAGQVVGYAHDAVERSRAFVWSSSQGMTDLGTLSGYTQARALGIGPSGSVVGVEFDAVSAVSHAFSWTPSQPNSTTGSMTNLARRDFSTATGVNSAGDIVGSSTSAWFVDDGSCTLDHPYYPNCGPGGTWQYESRAGLWDNGVGTDLTVAGFTLESANAINNAGQVTGQTDAGHAFRYDSDSGSGNIVYDLGTLGGTTSIGNAINDDGMVVGDSRTTGDDTIHAFRYIGTPDVGVMVDLGTLGGTFSHADDVNNSGLVVGYAARANGERAATLWLNNSGNTVVDLDVWLDSANPVLGPYWMLLEAHGINDNGLIIGVGVYNDGPDGLSDGYRAFLADASSLFPISTINGDFNNDGSVDAADYVVWRKNPAEWGGNPGGYDIWRMNFGWTSSATSIASADAAVPEPTNIAFVILALMAYVLRPARKA